MPVALIAAGIGAVGSIVSANGQRSAARNAANMQRETSNQEIALIERQREYAQGIARPHQVQGVAANQTLRNLWDYDPNDARAAAYGDRRALPGAPLGPRERTPSIFQNGGDPRFSTRVEGRDVMRVEPPARRTRPPPPPREPRFWESISADFLGDETPYQPPAPPAETPVPTGLPNGGVVLGVNYGGRPEGSPGFRNYQVR